MTTETRTIVFPSHDNLDFKIIENSDQRTSINDPIRQEILRVLTGGFEDYASEIRREQRTLEDGTRITEEVKIEKPVSRYWMTVPEILEKLRVSNLSLSLATTGVYYHLGKLQEQGLLEQFPDNASIKKKRVRGRYFRLIAKFFVDVIVEATVGHSGKEVMPAEIGPRFTELAERVRRSGVASSMQYQVALGEDLSWVSLTMSRHNDGMNIVAVVRDIATRHTLEERLRNDLDLIQSYIEAFQMLKTEDNTEVDNLANSVFATIERMSNLLSSLNNSQNRRKRQFSEFIDEVAKEAEGSEKGLKIHLKSEIACDAVHITSSNIIALVFMNLFRNASHHGGPNTEVEISMALKRRKLRVVVSDNGPGISPPMRDMLFLRGTSTKRDSSGLGLYLCKEIIERKGGSINLLPAIENQGASFEIILPLGNEITLSPRSE